MNQESIESYFKKFGITDPDIKIKLLPLITDLIYERNNNVVKSEAEENKDFKEALIAEAKETDIKINEVISSFLEENK